VLLVAIGIRRARNGPQKFDQRVHRFVIALGILNGFIFLTLQNIAMVDAVAALSSVLIYTQPLMVALGARIVLGEKLSPRRMVGLIAGWSGVIILVYGELDAGQAPLGASLMLLGAAFAWSVATLIFKWLPGNVDALRLLLWQNLYGLAPLLIVMGIGGNYDVTVGWLLLFSVFYVAVAASIGGYGLQFVLLRRGEAGVVSSWLFAVPIVASILGILLLNEAVHAGLLLGGVPGVAPADKPVRRSLWRGQWCQQICRQQRRSWKMRGRGLRRGDLQRLHLFAELSKGGRKVGGRERQLLR
jgi:drug/metabolite transporter (DMT)-like permease